MNATLVLERPPGQWRDRYRSYEVIVNDQLRGELGRGEQRTFEVGAGEVEIYTKIDWCRSRKIRLNVNPGSEIRLVCQPRNMLTALYGITFGRNNYIRLNLA
jgi:hypothetical protein